MNIDTMRVWAPPKFKHNIFTEQTDSHSNPWIIRFQGICVNVCVKLLWWIILISLFVTPEIDISILKKSNYIWIRGPTVTIPLRE